MSTRSEKRSSSLGDLSLVHQLVDSLSLTPASGPETLPSFSPLEHLDEQQSRDERGIKRTSLFDHSAKTGKIAAFTGDLGNFQRLWRYLEPTKDMQEGFPSELPSLPKNFCATWRSKIVKDERTLGCSAELARHLPPGGKVAGGGDLSDAIDAPIKKNPKGPTSYVHEAQVQHYHENLGEAEEGRRRAVIKDLLTPPLGTNNGPSQRSSHELFSGSTTQRGPLRVRPGITSATTHAQLRNIENPQSCVSKRQGLLSLLLRRFPEDTNRLKAVLEPSSSSQTAPEAKSFVHVFVDLSNIVIGFQDCLKEKNGMHKASPLRHRAFSFYNLSLILERGRPIAKRVLAGSDSGDPTREAGLLGYELCILQRVLKSAKARSAYRRRLRKTDEMIDSPSGTNSAYANQGMTSVEQGVDELLHLKIAQSLIDTDPPSTIVLASGDAAEAEFSDGFLKMITRALQRGWKVELAAFRSNLSSAYRKKAWTKRWHSRFRIIELDDYLPTLLRDGA